MTGRVLMSAQGLQIRFGGVVAADNINIDIHEGNNLAIIGPNGAGKTTFLNICTGYLKPHAGKVVFDGSPDELTTEAVRMIYGASDDGTEISESITSTSISAGRATAPAKPKSTGPLQPALRAKPAAAGVALPA